MIDKAGFSQPKVLLPVHCKTTCSIVSLFLTLLFSTPLHAQNDIIARDVQQLLGSLQPVSIQGAATVQAAAEGPHVSYSSDGYIRNLSAPPAHYFPTGKVIQGNPRQTAYNFIREHAPLFGATSAGVDFKGIKSHHKENRRYERFQQEYENIPFFGAEVMVQLNSQGGVEYLASDIVRNTRILDSGALSIKPKLSGQDAVRVGRDLFSAKYPGVTISSTEPKLLLFDPAILGSKGEIRLVWSMRITSESNSLIDADILLDAHNGELVREYRLNKSALNRTVYDSDNSTNYPGTLEREEGDPATGITDVDDAYDFLGSTYTFYLTNHGRDSMDGSGVALAMTVRYCQNSTDCPMLNAYGGSPHMKFGEGFAVDDIVAHEFTHGVTSDESGLIYENQSGAINESFSDVWGEFVDLTNGAGTDTAAVRWLMGEDLAVGAGRDMADPPAFDDPDRMGSALFYTGDNDYGGVHTNSGVNNKLCYLLSDGDTFNGQTVFGMGIPKIADLYYEVQTNILTSSSDYYDLYYALRQAAINLNWSATERNNLYRACLAVEIVASTGSVYVDGSYTGTEAGTFTMPYNTILEGYNSANPGDKLYVKNGPFNETLTFIKTLDIILWEGSTVVIGQ